MKYKISDRFWSDIKHYLDSNSTIYKWSQKPEDEFGLLTIESNQQWTTNQEHVIAQKLISQFHKQKITKPHLTARQWMNIYVNKLYQILPERQIVCNSLNNELLTIKYNELKNKITNKKKILAYQISRNVQERQKYSLCSEIEDKKLKAGIDNISCRIKLICAKQQEEDEQLSRVKNLIKNGMWGMLSQVEQKLHQILILQSQIEEIKKKQQQS